METFGYLSIAFVAIVSTAVGVRLLRVAVRTGGFPELALGLSLVGITGVGFPIVLLTELRESIGPVATFAADFTGSFIVALGFAGFYVFTWRVFRPDARWAAVLTGLASASVLVATAATVWIAVGIETNEAKFQAVRSWEILLFASAAAGFGWTAVEAFLYHARLRRRLRIGLADATVTNRVLLWALTGVSAATALGIQTLLRLADVAYMSAPISLFTVSVCGCLSSAFLYLAFLPPEPYLRRIRRAGPGA